MKTVGSITKAILDGSFTSDELRAINQAIKVAFDRQVRTAKLYFNVGEAVYFDTKNGERISGKIIKINQKTIQIRTTNGLWKVSASLVKKG